jgi:hypothetical protein
MCATILAVVVVSLVLNIDAVQSTFRQSRRVSSKSASEFSVEDLTTSVEKLKQDIVDLNKAHDKRLASIESRIASLTESKKRLDDSPKAAQRNVDGGTIVGIWKSKVSFPEGFLELMVSPGGACSLYVKGMPGITLRWSELGKGRFKAVLNEKDQVGRDADQQSTQSRPEAQIQLESPNSLWVEFPRGLLGDDRSTVVIPFERRD